MNEEVVELPDEAAFGYEVANSLPAACSPPIPAYLQETYWWAYLHPNAVRLFEREWLVNLILWGNMRRLTDAVLDEIALDQCDTVLQLACVYGNFSERLADHLKQFRAHLKIADVAPIQLRNAEKKLAKLSRISLHHQNSEALRFGDGEFSCTVVFFLLHEQPEAARRRTIAQAIRVTRPGGKIVIVDYHKPGRTNPLRYLMRPLLNKLEPFALDLWQHELASYMPPEIELQQLRLEHYFGGLYQKLVVNL